MIEYLSARSALENIYNSDDSITTQLGTPRILIQEVKDLTLLHIACHSKNDDVSECVSKFTKYKLPLTPNTSIKGKRHYSVWLSPTSWLIYSQEAINTGTLYSQTLHITDISSGQVLMRVSGRHVRDLLSKGCPIDLHQANFDHGYCAQSRFRSINILLNVIDETTIDIFVARSFAVVFYKWLIEDSAEYRIFAQKK